MILITTSRPCCLNFNHFRFLSSLLFALVPSANSKVSLNFLHLFISDYILSSRILQYEELYGSAAGSEKRAKKGCEIVQHNRL